MPFGRMWPWWQLLQVTTVLPSKLRVLMSRSMAIIFRAVSFAGFASDSHSFVWHCPQVTPRELDMNAMTGMSCEEGRPCSTLMFFFVCSTGRSFDCAEAKTSSSAAMTILINPPAERRRESGRGLCFRRRSTGSRSPTLRPLPHAFLRACGV